MNNNESLFIKDGCVSRCKPVKLPFVMLNLPRVLVAAKKVAQNVKTNLTYHITINNCNFDTFPCHVFIDLIKR